MADCVDVSTDSLLDVDQLPWGSQKERRRFPESMDISVNCKPGEFVAQGLFAEFTVLAEKKIEQVLNCPDQQRSLSRSLQRQEDSTFDQVLSSLNSVAEHCLPCMLRALFEWYDKQVPLEDQTLCDHKGKAKVKERDYLCEKRELAVDFLFCLALIELLKQLPFHPGQDDAVNHVITLVFRHLRYREPSQLAPNNNNNVNIVAEIYAEVLGVLAAARFVHVRKRFTQELKEMRSREQSPAATHNVINLLMGLKFFRVKMHPIEEFQACIAFLQELGNYFLEVRPGEKEIRHAIAGLFVEILLPVAAVVKSEVNIPVIKNFVESIYQPTLDLSTKRKHHVALYPMVTCLLCVSHKQFFLNNWPNFLNMCLNNFRARDAKLARVSLESLYRLLWVYMIRVKCESNTATLSRLQSVVTSLFPRGSKGIMPRDAPLNIFVKIIQFIAQERLDFAMKDIIFDLLSVGKIRSLNPERMSIGLRAFLVIADSLQRKEGDPPMPQTMGVHPSGSTLKTRKTFISKHLSDDQARSMGMSLYYPHVRKAFDTILRRLDAEVGRPLLTTNRLEENIITNERKRMVDLFRTCVAAVPRLLPEGLTQTDLIDLLWRLTLHVDAELAQLAQQSLVNIVTDLPAWRPDVLRGYITFMHKDVSDTFSQLDACNRRLINVLQHYKQVAQNNLPNKIHQSPSSHSLDKEKDNKNDFNNEIIKQRRQQEKLEGLCLVMIGHGKLNVRKQGILALKEIRLLHFLLNLPKDDEPCVLDVLDQCCPTIIEKVVPSLPLSDREKLEKPVTLQSTAVDFWWLADRTSIICSSTAASYLEVNENNNASGSCEKDPWVECLSIFLRHDLVPGQCVTAVQSAWPLLYARLQTLSTHEELLTLPTEGRTSFIQRGPKKSTGERDMLLSMWRSYVLMACSITPSVHQVAEMRSASPDLPSSSPESSASERPSSLSRDTARDLYKLLVPLIKSDMSDMRETIIIGLGHSHPRALRELVEELSPVIKEAIERSKENIRRRKKRDLLRLALARLFFLLAESGFSALCPAGIIDGQSGSLCAVLVEYIDGARQVLKAEEDKDQGIVQDIRLYFPEFIRYLIQYYPVNRRHRLLPRDLRYHLFYLFASWSGRFGHTFGAVDRRPSKEESCSELELLSAQAMAAVLTCGPAFEQQGLLDDGYVYLWLNALLASHEETIYRLAQETIVLLLEFNPDAHTLLDWVIDRCYTGSAEIADGCFSALAIVFNDREYPCDHVAMLNVTLLYTGCPRSDIHEAAVQLLHLLYKRFFMDDVILHDPSGEHQEDAGSSEGAILRQSAERRHRKALQDMLLSGPYSRSQLDLSQTLASLHPDLTMPMMSEMTLRFQTAVPSVRQVLLQCMQPWIFNCELVDHNLNAENLRPLEVFKWEQRAPLRGEGWGSTQATEMVLNNLFYITAKFGDEHPKEVEEFWASLVLCWPNNLRVIMRYLLIITGLSPELVLPYSKRVIVYLARNKPERLMEELVLELRTIECLNYNIERTQTPPFYRLTSLRRGANCSQDEELDGDQCQLNAGTGTGPVMQRLSGSDEGRSQPESTVRTSSTMSLRSETSSSSAAATLRIGAQEEEESPPQRPASASERRSDSPVPYPLPMPAFGGYFAPLSDLLPDEPSQPYQRCNLAVMLVSDHILDCLDMKLLIQNLPILLHIIFLGLDNSRPMVHEHCKKVLLNLLLVVASHNDHFNIAKIFLANKHLHDERSLTVLPSDKGEMSLSEELEPSHDEEENVKKSTLSVNSAITVTPDNVSGLSDQPSIEMVAKVLIEFLVTRTCRPLWTNEDITSKMHQLKSAEQLEQFLKHVVRVFAESLPSGACLESRWAEEALRLALSCSSRHYAGRSFQVFQALEVALSLEMLSDILSRLVETVTETGEEMQGYVTEIMLTLIRVVDTLEVDDRPMDYTRNEQFMSTPNLHKEAKPDIKKAATVALRNQLPHVHLRTTSFSPAAVARRNVTSSPPVMEHKAEGRQRHLSEEEMARKGPTVQRSRSSQSLKHLQDPSWHDERLNIFSQLFWIAVCLLESDFEHEFQLACRLLLKILKHLQPDRPECREKLDKILQQMHWDGFPGVQALLLKGATSPVTSDVCWKLLSRLTLCINAPAVDPGQVLGFPMNVIALLPYMVEQYEEPSQQCVDAAHHISQMALEQSSRLENLATVMTLYSRGTFAKDSFQWTKCVIKYLYDVYCNLNAAMIGFLVEVLEKGPATWQPSLLQILHCMVHYVDIQDASNLASINSDLLKVVAKCVEGPHWKEALKILKLCVTRCSTLSDPPPRMSAQVHEVVPTSGALPSHTSFAEAEISFKKELPGRTMEFTFDISQVPVIGLKYIPTAEADTTHEKDRDVRAAFLQPDRGAQGDVHDLVLSGWRRPQFSQTRTRQRLGSLLQAYGPREIPKSPSDSSLNKVIFSVSSDTMCDPGSSSESSSQIDGHGGSRGEDDSSLDIQAAVAKPFDFLDKELDDEFDELDPTAQRPAWGTGTFGLGSYPSSVSDDEGRSRSTSTHPADDSSEDETDSKMSEQDTEGGGDLPSELGESDSLPRSLAVQDSATISVGSPDGSAPSIPTSSANLSPLEEQPDYQNQLEDIILKHEESTIEELWSDHFNTALVGYSDKVASGTFSLFARLFQEVKYKVRRQTKEAAFYLSKTDSIREIASMLADVLDTLCPDNECPLVFVDPEAMVACKVLDHQQSCLLEINENYETYLMIKRQSKQLLENLKSSVELQSLEKSVTVHFTEEQKLELCACLYKLHYQLIQLHDSYTKLVRHIYDMPKPEQVTDLSERVDQMYLDLNRAKQELDQDHDLSPFQLDTHALSRVEAEAILLDYMFNRNYIKALHLMRNLRNMFPGDKFGVNPSDEIETLLYIYCEHQSHTKPGVVMIYFPEERMRDVLRQLIDVKTRISAMDNQVRRNTRSEQDQLNLSTPESSTL